MHCARWALLLAGPAALAACTATPTPVVGLPGPNKDLAAFQKDDAACRQAAAVAAHPGTAAAPAQAPANTTAQWQQYFASYTQCETAHGDLVAPVPWTAAYAAYLGYPAPYAYPYAVGYYPWAYGYPYFYGYPYPFFFGGFNGFGYGHYGHGHFAHGAEHGGGGHH